MIDVLQRFGWQEDLVSNVTLNEIEQSLEAEEERTLIAIQGGNERRSGIIVQCFPKDVDNEKVEKALRTLDWRPTLWTASPSITPLYNSANTYIVQEYLVSAYGPSGSVRQARFNKRED